MLLLEFYTVIFLSHNLSTRTHPPFAKDTSLSGIFGEYSSKILASRSILGKDQWLVIISVDLDQLWNYWSSDVLWCQPGGKKWKYKIWNWILLFGSIAEVDRNYGYRVFSLNMIWYNIYGVGVFEFIWHFMPYSTWCFMQVLFLNQIYYDNNTVL